MTRRVGLVDYEHVWRAMIDFTSARGPDTPDEIWITQHPAIFTLGQAGSREDLLRATDIPLVRSDRGGQITYHGPGQLILYVLFDLRRSGLGVRKFVRLLERSVIDYLATFSIPGERLQGAPGVYVGGSKVAQLGVRIKRGCSYHGIALNVDMDLGPFAQINPCGFKGMKVTQLRDLGVATSLEDAGAELARRLRVLLCGPGVGEV